MITMLHLMQTIETIAMICGFAFAAHLWKHVLIAIFDASISDKGDMLRALSTPSLLLAGSMTRTTIVGSMFLDRPLIEPSTLGVEADVVVPPRVYENEVTG